MTALHPFAQLTPEHIIAAVESVGLCTDGRILALNSYENRVYQVGIEADSPKVVKFYRPGRWSAAAIQEEHDFAAELRRAQVPVVAPDVYAGRTLFTYQQFHFAVFTRQGGRWPELSTHAERVMMGRFLGRIHQVGRTRRFEHRASLSVRQWALESQRCLLTGGWIPDHLKVAYESVSTELIARMQVCFDDIQPLMIRLHGDCHLGNVLWADHGPHFVDLDDCIQGPAMQDLWLLLAGNRMECEQQLGALLEGYTQFTDFDYSEIRLIEVLRTLRLMHYAAWLARRWDDPAFPRAFPWFGELKFWEQHVQDLREQMAAMEEMPLTLH